MKNLNLFNLKSIVRSKARWLLTLIAILTLGVGQMWAAYYVTGSTATVGSWNAAGKEMTQVGTTSTYYKTFTNFNESNTQIKVTNGTWDQSWGGSNIQSGADISLSAEGDNIKINGNPNKTITVWFNQANNKVWVTGAAYATQKVYFIGANSWTDSNVKAHVFLGDAAYYAWGSDQTMTKESTISRAGITYKVYSYTFPNGYKNVIFRYPSSAQTSDLTWSASTPYYSIELSDWYATTADALAKYLVGTNWTSASWDNTDAANKMTDNGDGSYSKNISISDATKEIALKISKKGTWTDAWGGAAKGTGYNLSQDFGTDGDGNLTFKVTHSGTTKITLTSAGKINVGAPYQVSYAAGTGATGTVSASTVTTYGSTCTLSSSTFSKTGYTQDGWATSNGGSKSYNLGATYTGGYTDVTLYPHWVENSYTVTYTATVGGSVTTPATSSSTVGQVTGVSIEATPSSGYHFDGWSITSGTGSITDPASASTTFFPTSTATIKASFAADAEDTHNVTISYKYGDTSIKDNTTESSVGVETARSVTAPSITGYTFSSWTLGDGLTNKSANTTTNPISIVTKATGSYTLTANYTLNSHNVIFNANGGSGTMSNESFNYNQTKALTANTLTRTGYVFKGWATSEERADAGTVDKTDGANYTMGDADVTLYAVWWKTVYFVCETAETTIKAHVWYTESATNYDYKAWASDEVMTNTGSTVNGRTIYSYSFPECYNKAIFRFGSYQTADLTSFTAGQYYYFNGATTSESRVGTWYASVAAIREAWKVYGSWNKTGNDWNSNNFTSYGESTATYTVNLAASTTYNFKYVFGGTNTWYGNNEGTMSDGTAKSINSSGGDLRFTSTVAGTYTFTINYSTSTPTAKVDFPVSYTLTYGIGSIAGTDGTITSSPSTASGSKVLSGSSITLTAPAAKTGYEWKGWYLNTEGSGVKQCETATYAVTMNADKTLYACYEETLYTITVSNSNSTAGTITAPASPATTVQAGVATHPTITAVANTGYHFTGWTKTVNESNVTIANASAASTTISNATGTATVQANWAANTYTIVFDPNDDNYVGTATGTTASIADKAYDAASYTLTTNGFSRTGYTFAGWNSEADGRGTDYSNGQSITSPLTDENGATITLYAKWTGNGHTVHFNYGSGSGATSNKAVTFGSAYGELPTVTPPSGCIFGGWYTAASGGTLVDADTLVTIDSDHTLYARITQRDRVYFYNNLGWSSVYVTYDAYWVDATYGAANNGKTYQAMTQMGETNIWYADIPDAILSSWKYFVAFNEKNAGSAGSGTYNRFDDDKVVFRHDFDSYATMFVPQSSKADKWDKNVHDGKKAEYYSSSWTYDAAEGGHGENYRQNVGYWMRYNDIKSGYCLTGSWDSWANTTSFKAEVQGTAPYVVTKTLAANTTYEFLLYKEYSTNSFNHVFTNTSTMTSANCTNLEFTSTNTKYSSLASNHAKITTTVAGEYTFKLTPGEDGTLKISVDYPFAVNDYRVLYTWNDGSEHTHSSEIIKAAASTEKKISVFVHKAANVTSQSLKIQQCTSISGAGIPTWTDRNTITLSASEITANGVYNFVITQPASGYATGAFSEKYDGNYYIRTESSNGGWEHYKDYADNIMTLSDYSLTQTLSAPYSHYYCRYISNTNMDITYQIATDYSPCVSDVMIGDATIGAEATTLPSDHPASVRFSWNEQTNAMRRAYLKSAQGSGNNRYLVLHGESAGMIYNNDATGTAIAADDSKGLAANELLFTDLGNWVYQVELKAQPGSKIKLIANYNDYDRYLVGDAKNSQTLIGGSGSTKYPITAVYDFKSNRLMTAWKPNGAITDAIKDVDIMLIRHAQEGATTITFNGGSLDANKVIGALEMRYDELHGRVTNWTSESRPLLKFMISFPFDVNVSDVFGLNSAYGEAYVIQKYNGALRAEKGFFRGDGTTTFWEDLTIDSVMHANEGYCVILDNDYFNGTTGSVWDNKGSGSKVYLYFPSATNVGNISATSKSYTVPSHLCTSNRTWGSPVKSHAKTDSHWNMIGVPILSNHAASSEAGSPGAVLTGDGDFKYYYEWNPSDNQFSIATASSTIFRAMYGYMVQYTGSITFTGSALVPASIAARQTAEKKDYTLELQVLNSDDAAVNHTYVELSDGADDQFALNEDVYMSLNNNAVNIYTFAGNYEVAANVMSIGNHTIPLGVTANKAGTYFISSPSNFNGSVILIDTYTGTRTNLALSNYEVDLTKGTINDRFVLEISDLNKVYTDVEFTQGEGNIKDGKAHKFLQNGVLYILRDNKLYDARGARVE